MQHGREGEGNCNSVGRCDIVCREGFVSVVMKVGRCVDDIGRCYNWV